MGVEGEGSASGAEAMASALKALRVDVVVALDLSRVVMRRIRINFGWAFGYNLIGIPLAAGVLYPVWKIHLPPMFAGATMSLSSILVVCSSLHLKCFAPPKLPIVGGARSVVPL